MQILSDMFDVTVECLKMQGDSTPTQIRRTNVLSAPRLSLSPGSQGPFVAPGRLISVFFCTTKVPRWRDTKSILQFWLVKLQLKSPTSRNTLKMKSAEFRQCGAGAKQAFVSMFRSFYPFDKPYLPVVVPRTSCKCVVLGLTCFTMLNTRYNLG